MNSVEYSGDREAKSTKIIRWFDIPYFTSDYFDSSKVLVPSFPPTRSDSLIAIAKDQMNGFLNGSCRYITITVLSRTRTRVRVC